jgi:hypothetical protein
VAHGNATHGMAGTRTYQSWCSMIARCGSHPDYAGRGIKVCARWRTFANFLADMGERPEGLTLDRYPDNDGNYRPGNCRWATPKQQAENRRRRKNTIKERRQRIRDEFNRQLEGKTK